MRAGSQSESGLVLSTLHGLLRRRGLLVCEQVPVLGRSADLAFIRGGAVVTVEFKLRDWRRALAQARDHLLAADYAWVCMPRRSVTPAMRDAFKREGVGLTFYQETGAWPFEPVIEATRSREPFKAARSFVSRYIRDHHGASA